LVQRKIVNLQYIATSEHVADILTKPLTLRQFVQLRENIGVVENDSLAEREVKFGSIDNHSPMRGHMGHPEASQGYLENQQVL
jgi:hypothetical protein